MKCLVIALAYFLAVHRAICVGLGGNPDLNNYLQILSESVYETFTGKSHLVSRRMSNSVEVDQLESITYPGTYRTGSIFTFFNTTYILMDNEVALITPTDGTFSINEITTLADKGKIIFTKAIQYNQLDILLTTLESETHIYRIKNNSITSVQSISTPFATDAKFFTNNGRLYLIIIYNKGDNLAQMSIYKWLGTYFDEIDTSFNTGALKMHSFGSKSSEIITILQHLPNKKISSTVYAFDFEKIRKIQHLTTTDPVHIDSYTVGTKVHVVVFEKSRKNIIYLWDGSKLVKFSQFETNNVIQRTAILQINESTLVLAALTDRLQVFRPSTEGLQLEDEEHYPSNYSVVLDVHERQNTRSSITFIVGLSEDNIININVMSLKVHLTEMEKDQTKDTLRECFNTLETKVYSRRQTLREFKEMLNIVSPEDNSKTILSSVKEAPEREGGLIEIRERLDKLQLSLKDYPSDGDDITITGTTTIKGFVKANKLSATDISIRKINGQNWTPEQWLMYREPQTITGPVDIQNIAATHLETSDKLIFFKDLFLRNGDQKISGNVTIGNLTANEMFARKVNDVAMEDIYDMHHPRLITGLKTFKKLRTNEAKINLLNKQSPDKVLSLFTRSPITTDFDNNVEVENLVIEYINDVHWDTFINSTFRIGESTEINGNLTFSEIKTTNLTLKTLNGVKIEDLLTTSTDQIIESDIEFMRLHGVIITTGTVNGIVLVDSVVQVSDNATIEGPVKFDRLNVEKDLELTGKLDESFFLRSEDHIIGTNESDLFQTYRGKIRVLGNLYLNNLTIESEAQVLIAEEPMDLNFSSIYWTKSTHQVIPVRVLVHDVTVPHMLADMLNGKKMSQYMINGNGEKLETRYYFQKVSIAGNVALNTAAKHKPDFNKLDKEAVKTNGSFIITGKKKYLDTLRVEHLALTVLDDIVIHDTLNINWTGNITGKKIFENVIIDGDFTSDVQSLEFINDINITQLLDKAMYIDEPQDLKRLHFKNITVSDLYVKTLNDHHPNEYIWNLNGTYSMDKINNLTVHGNVTINTVQNLSTINDIEFENLLNNAMKMDAHGIFHGNIQFLGHVKIENLFTTTINDINLPGLTSRFLYRNISQNITAPWSFTNIRADNIIASKINNISVENPVDVSSKLPQIIYAPNGIEFSSARLLRSLQAADTSPCNLEQALNSINDPPTKEWYKMEIQKNITVMDTDNILHRVIEQAVTKNSKNIIRAPVNFTSNILGEIVTSRKGINDVNIQDVINDAVLMDSTDTQVITGHKYFDVLSVLKATVLKNTDSPVVNDINIPSLIDVMIYKGDDQEVSAKGRKTFFGGLQCDRFYSKKLLNTKPENLVSVDNPQTIPSATFDSLGIENYLNIRYVNRINFDRILRNRLLTEGPDVQTVTGVHYFEDVEVENMLTPSINDIKIDSVVFDTEQNNITSPKFFMQTVEVFGNANTNYINGINITAAYEKSVVKEEETNIDGSITLLRPSVVNGTINTEYINGVAVDDIKQILGKGTTKIEAQKMYDMKNHITGVVKRSIPHVKVMTNDYMYIEMSDNLQISVPNVISAKAITSKGYVLIHVTGEESGKHCGLPDTCKCPVQFSMEISPEHSVATFPNKGFQRTFSYDDNNMIVHFITNSVSTDCNCRTDNARVLNEVSMMTWTTLSTANTTGMFYQYEKFITGFISGVEFFSLNGQSYAIIGRYYDPSTNTHDLDCVVIKFNEDKSKAMEIQKIPAKGTKSIYLFHAVQGVTLIIGNGRSTHSLHEDEETTIYTFDEIKQQFDLLRTIPSYGCSMATGVVLGTDSLIILAHKVAPLQVLKYSEYYNNYYFYQSIELDASVLGMSVFYTGGFGISDAYLCIVTENETFFIYSFRFIEGWKLESSGEMEGLRNLIPFELNAQPYLFAPSTRISSLLTVVIHGSV